MSGLNMFCQTVSKLVSASLLDLNFKNKLGNGNVQLF